MLSGSRRLKFPISTAVYIRPSLPAAATPTGIPIYPDSRLEKLIRQYHVDLVETFQTYPHIGTLLPAMGYSSGQIKDLEETINDCPCDLVLSATPIDLAAVVTVNKPVVRVGYEYRDNSTPTLEDVVREKLVDCILLTSFDREEP